jgi:hypothetical protein
MFITELIASIQGTLTGACSSPGASSNETPRKKSIFNADVDPPL